MQNISTNTLYVGYLLRIYISTNIPQYSFITQMYGSEHTARRRGRFIAPVFQPNQMVLMWRNDANCNANNANMQRHFVGVRGYGHDKSDPTPTEWTWRYVDYNK